MTASEKKDLWCIWVCGYEMSLSYYSNEFCLKLGHGVFFGLMPTFVFASKPATPLSSSHTCTTIDGVEILFPKRVTSFDGCNSWFLPIKNCEYVLS